MKITIGPRREYEDLLDALNKAMQFNKIYRYTKHLTPTYNERMKRIRQNKRFFKLKEKITKASKRKATK